MIGFLIKSLRVPENLNMIFYTASNSLLLFNRKKKSTVAVMHDTKQAMKKY